MACQIDQHRAWQKLVNTVPSMVLLAGPAVQPNVRWLATDVVCLRFDSVSPIIATVAGDWDDSRFAAEMTDRQFRALRARLRAAPIHAGVPNLGRVLRPTLARSFDQSEVRRWLFNGWNTENLLTLTASILENDDNASALQWSFPQAYYSAYAVLFAFFKVAGFTEQSHTAVIRKFGELVAAGDYPPELGFHADGWGENIEVFNLIPAEDESSIALDTRNPASVDKQIAQFLVATRRLSLDEKKTEMKFKTKGGKPAQRLSAEQWQKVSDKVGQTTILSLLYRKRIKANYRDIDTIAFAGIDAAGVHHGLLHVVTALNYVNEVFIAAALGSEKYHTLVNEFMNLCPLERLKRRLPHVLAAIE